MDRLSLDEEHYTRQEEWRRQLPESLGDGLRQGLSRLGISLLGMWGRPHTHANTDSNASRVFIIFFSLGFCNITNRALVTHYCCIFAIPPVNIRISLNYPNPFLVLQLTVWPHTIRHLLNNTKSTVSVFRWEMAQMTETLDVSTIEIEDYPDFLGKSVEHKESLRVINHPQKVLLCAKLALNIVYIILCFITYHHQAQHRSSLSIHVTGYAFLLLSIGFDSKRHTPCGVHNYRELWDGAVETAQQGLNKHPEASKTQVCLISDSETHRAYWHWNQTAARIALGYSGL